jgi:UDP-glucose 4-epimerase
MAEAIHNQQAYNQIFNIGADRSCTILELLDCVAEEMGANPEKIFLAERNEVRHAVSNHDKIRRYFRVPNSLPLEEGICRMANWAKSIGPRPTRLFEPLEITKKLPDGWA